MCWLSKLFGVSGIERPSPSDWVMDDAVVTWTEFIPWRKLNVELSQKPKIWIPMIPDTNSMDGVFDFGNNNILIAGMDETDHQKLLNFLAVGDIAVYQTVTNLIIHRIVEIGNDSQGRYFIFKGDNNTTADPDRVRESQIQWISIGTIY